jgi:ABC-type multidrug transport system fused ATPase/permease subunit
VIDYDRIIVLDKGKVVEFDSPSSLMKKPNSLFYALAKESGLLK